MKPEKTKDRWRTPAPVLAFVREVFGGKILLDPATDPDNPTGAVRFFTRADNALERTWPFGSRVFLNPPFSRLLPFARAMQRQCSGVRVMVASYSLEAEWAEELATATPWGNFDGSIEAGPFVITPSPRLRFDLPPDEDPDRPQPGGYPATVWVWSAMTARQLAAAWLHHVGGRVGVYRRVA